MMLTVTLSGDPLVTAIAADADGMSRVRVKDSSSSAMPSLMMDTLKLITFTPAGKVTEKLSSW